VQVGAPKPGAGDREPWVRPPRAPLLPEGEAHLWRVRLPRRLSLATERRLAAVLPAEDRERCGRFRRPAHRRRALAARLAVRRILARYLDLPPESLALARTQQGKPYLRTHTDLHFSLAHSGQLLLVALCRGARVGVDVERECEVPVMDLLARRFFSGEEQRAIQAARGGERRRVFFRLWTRREAAVKALGIGLLDSFRRFALPAVRASPAGLEAVLPPERGTWWLRDFKPGRGYSGALCVEGEGACLRRWRWDAAARPGPRAGRSARRS
jgi:4'-phosphopantetheinyl transferase